MERIIRMVLRQLLRRGVDKGISMAARRGQDPDAPETRERERTARDHGRRAQRAMRMARRMGRF